MILLLGSLTFYFVSTLHNPLHFTLLIFSIILDFYTGLCIENSTKHKKVFLITSVLLHLTILCIFKYSNFVLGELKNTFDFEILKSEIVLPIGISFYTFQSISYIADIYTKKSKAEKSLLNYAVYISMFPQLIAGPIVTYSDIKEDLKVKHITKQKVLKAMGIFVFGLGLKVLLANPLGKLWSQVLAIGFESITTPLAWLALFAYSFQLYFDFFAYSLMAVGLGGMLGFKIPKNFNHPYTSLTMSEFWRRWHITLGAWFKNYVYIPLGGNKKGKAKMVLNLLTVWVLTGIWHGAGYNFIIWGLIIFITITGEKLLYGNALK